MQRSFFEFDGTRSQELGVQIVAPDIGLLEHTIWTPANIDERVNKNSYTRTIYNIEREPMEFRFSISLIDDDGGLGEWTPELISELTDWLIHDTYKELRFGHEQDKVHYAIMSDPSPFQSIDSKGYVELTFRTNAPHGWTKPIVEIYECNNQVDIIEIDALHNIGKFYYPELEIQSETGGSMKIINKTDGGKEMSFTKLMEGENFYINNQTKEIVSGIPQRNLFPQFNRNWLRLSQGTNVLEVIGKCKILIKSQFPIV